MSSHVNASFSEPYDSAAHQRTAVIFGVWVFLATEILFFGGLFVAYGVYHYEYPTAFIQGSQKLNVWSGGIMTAILLLGSLLVAVAEHRMQHECAGSRPSDQEIASLRRAISWRLFLTAILGVLFLSLEFREYAKLISEGLFPGAAFEQRSPGDGADSGRSAEIFFALFFFMTGLHALHMIIGITLVSGLALIIASTRELTNRSNAVTAVALYWHFVDIVWIFLYPLFYLVR